MLRTLFVACLLLVAQPAPASDPLSVDITKTDPGRGARLAAYDKLYLKVSYESEVPIRFEVSALRKGARRKFGAMNNPGNLVPEGKHDTLVWISYSNATRIDEVVLNVLDAEWRQLGQYRRKVDVAWTDQVADDQREPAAWVKALIRKERLRQEFVFDPKAGKQETLLDAFFVLSLVTIPIYLYLQVRFLRKWRRRWRQMAVIPIVSVTPLLALPIFGLGLEFRLWIIFIFRGMPLALVFLVCLWLAKWITEKRMDRKG